jgi:hypothetical protein
VPGSFALNDPKLVAALRRDLPMYLTEIERMRSQNLFRVPYLLTQSIIDAANDRGILQVVWAVLETDDILMWGPNLQIGTPNEAGVWHTDIESWLWPTVTVVVGLAGCQQENAPNVSRGHKILNTSHGQCLLGITPIPERCFKERKLWMKVATRLSLLTGSPMESVICSTPSAGTREPKSKSTGRKLLFLHYSRAEDTRILYMEDYERRTWFEFPATWMRIGDAEVNENLYSVEGKNYRGPVRRGD